MENNKQNLDFIKSMIQDIIDNIDNKLVEFLKPLYFNPNFQSWSVPIDSEYFSSSNPAERAIFLFLKLKGSY